MRENIDPPHSKQNLQTGISGGVVIGALAGVILGVMGKVDLAATAGRVLGYLISIPISIWTIKVILEKDLKTYSIIVVKNNSEV